MSVRAGGAEEMFLDVKELAVHKLRIRRPMPGQHRFSFRGDQASRTAGSDRHGRVAESQIRIEGNLETKIELVCARCLEPVVEDVSRSFDLFYAPLPKDAKPKEDRLKDDDTEIGFYQGSGSSWRT